MSSVRVPGSLRRAGSSGRLQARPTAPRTDSRTATLATAAALITAASPLSTALAQGTLPPLSVESAQARKKAKAAPAAKGREAAPPANASAAPVKAANPYADPNAPYKVDKSASGKLTEPLVDTPRTVTAIPKEVVEDKGARDIRELARSVPGLTIGSAEGGNAYGADLSVTLFLAEPDEYDGGELTVEDRYGTQELTVEDRYGTQEVKLPAGDLVLYPATSLHHVKPVTRGVRIASFFWLQSMVRDDNVRTMLFDLDQTIQELTAEKGIDDAACVRLTGLYHNLVRYWADA
jgi:hypothetical protein